MPKPANFKIATGELETATTSAKLLTFLFSNCIDNQARSGMKKSSLLGFLRLIGTE